MNEKMIPRPHRFGPNVGPVTPMGKMLGAKKDKHDGRDWLYSARLPGEQLVTLPASTDLSKWPQPPIYDQGNIGSCVDNALAACLGFDEAKSGNGVELMSRLFMYWLARHGLPFDEGSTLRDALDGVYRKGVCLENLWPYDTAKWAQMAPPAAWGEAWHRIGSMHYYRLTTLNDMKTCLAQNYPFIFGIAVYESFEFPGPNRTGMIPMPNKRSEILLGGHALAAMGYDDARQAFLFRNSWGTGWGLAGWAWIPYAYLLDPDLGWDFWTARHLAK